MFSYKLLLKFIATVMVLAFYSMAARAEESLRVLAWPGYADADLVRTFEQRYGVKVEVTIINSDDYMWERLSDRNGDNFDVFAVNTAELQRYIDKGISVPIVMANIPNTTKQLPRFRDLSSIPGITRNGDTYAIPYTYSEMGLIYDRKAFKNPPNSFSIMWDKRYKGRVLAYHGSEHNFTLTAMVLELKNPFSISSADFKKVTRHLVELRRNVLSFYGSPEEATSLFMRHHVALLFANYGTQQVNMLKNAGADIGYVIPKEGALAWLDCWSITRGAKNRKLAELWINYMLEVSASHALTERQGLANTLEASTTMHDADKILWLQRVEDVGKRTALWEKIISGSTLDKL